MIAPFTPYAAVHGGAERRRLTGESAFHDVDLRMAGDHRRVWHKE